MEIVVFILGGCHSHISPFHIQCNRPFPDWGYLCPWVCFSFSYTTLPALSCPPVICFCCTRHSTFSPLWTWSKWHGSICCERSQTCSQSTVLTLFSKNSYGCNICIPFLWFESRNLQCFFTSFLIWGMKMRDWDLICKSPAWQHVCHHQTIGPPWRGGFLTVVSMLHDKHSSPSSCSPASYSLSPKIEG